MAEPLQLGKRPSPTGGKLRLLTLRQATGSPDQMRQAGLPGLNPPLIDAIPIADQQPRPLLNERGKGFFGAARMDHIEPMVLVAYILYSYFSILQTKFSDREEHKARRGGLE